MYRTILLLSASLAVASSTFAAPLAPWPAQAKANAAGMCKQNIRDSVAQSFLTMTNSTELPADFYEKAAPQLNPMMAACDCAVGKLEKQFGYDYYSAHLDDMPPKIQGMITGVCRPKPPVEADETP
jgi:hypothetical protein